MVNVNALVTAKRIIELGISGPIGDLAAAYAAREVLNEFINTSCQILTAQEHDAIKASVNYGSIEALERKTK